jgi:hypothetical protein
MRKALFTGMVGAGLVGLLALLLVFTARPAENTANASGGTGASPITFGIDVDPAGNGTSIVVGPAAESGIQCNNSADDDDDGSVNDGCGLGLIDACIRVDYAGPGTDFNIDVFVDDIPTGKDLGGFDWFLNYDSTLLHVLARVPGTGAPNWLLGSTPGSSVGQYGNTTWPSTTGWLNESAADTAGAAGGEPAGSYGVLERYTLRVIAPGPALTSLTLTPAPDYISANIPAPPHGIVVDEVFDGNHVLPYGVIAIDTPCAVPTLTPTPPTSPTATGTPTATATPTPTAPSLAAGWNHVCYLGAAGPVDDALAEIGQDLIAVYRLTLDQGFDRWFPDRPEASTMTSVNPYESLLILMANSRSWSQSAATPLPTSHHLAEGWNSVCYAGETKDVETATASIAGQFNIVYALTPEQTWERFIPGRPEVSNLDDLSPFSAVFVLVTQAAGAQWLFDP